MRLGARLHAALRERVITVEQRGLASSNMDLVEPLAPLIPPLLRMGRSRSLENPYFLRKRAGKKFRIQLFTRMESLRTWTELRRADESALTPDEFEVISSLLSGAKGEVVGITDYPSEGSTVLQIGRKLYHESSIDVREYLGNLRIAGDRAVKNSYLPRSSILEVEHPGESSRRHEKLSASLGEWCYLSF